MRDLVNDFSNQLREALEVSKVIRITESENDILNVVVGGLGGSGIGANIVQSIVQDELEVPFTIIKSYDLPNFVNAQTLVICSSFSGNTEETISMYQQAKDRGSKVCVITSGGFLEQSANDAKDDIAILPSKIKSPRANLGYSAVQLLHVLEAYSLISDSFKLELENSILLLNHNKTHIRSTAKELALEYKDMLPILYSDSRFHPILIRNQQQINENGKQLCHVNVFPEFNHNELVGWVYPESICNKAIVTIFKTDFDHARVKQRMVIAKPILEKKACKVIEIQAKGTSFIEQAFYIIHLFDLVSVELAELNNVDPTPVEVIDFLKSELAKTNE